MPLVYSQLGNVKKSKKLMKLANIEEEIFISSERLKEFQ